MILNGKERNVNPLKNEIKKILIGKQHKKYEAQVREKKLSYPKWIAQQEQNLKRIIDFVKKN